MSGTMQGVPAKAAARVSAGRYPQATPMAAMPLRQSHGHQVPYTMSDHGLVLFDRVRRESTQFHRVVHRRSQVADRIEQRPVQVEYHKFPVH